MEYGYIIKYYNKNKKKVGKLFKGDFKSAKIEAKKDLFNDKKCIAIEILNESKNNLCFIIKEALQWIVINW